MFDGFYLYKEIFFGQITLKVEVEQFKKKFEIFILMLWPIYWLKYGYNAYLSINIRVAGTRSEILGQKKTAFS